MKKPNDNKAYFYYQNDTTVYGKWYDYVYTFQMKFWKYLQGHRFGTP